MFVKQKNVWLRNYKVMNRLQAHHFFFSTSMWEILREHITPSQVADQNTAGFALILFARGLHHMKITKKKTGNWSNVIKSEVT